MSNRRRQGGQAIVLIAILMVALIGMAALAVDLGYAMSDRRVLQATADSAAVAGARSYPQGNAAAHYIAMQYLAANLNFSLPIGSCVSNSACPAGTYAPGPYTITLRDSAGPALDLTVRHTQSAFFAPVIGVSTVVAGTSARATAPGPSTTATVYALAAVSGDALINGGGAAFQTVGGPVYALGSFGANNVPHATGIPSVQTNFDGTTCAGSPPNHLDNGGTGNLLIWTWTSGAGAVYSNVPRPLYFDSAAPTLAQPAPVFTATAMAQDGAGNWKPGIYSGIFPSGGLMNPGVYKIVNVNTTIALGNITNAIHTPSGTADPNGAVAIMLDSSDTGALDLSDAKLNGLDDLYGSGYTGTAQRDPQGTHNFVIWGGNGATGYSGQVTIGPHATTDMSGIIYLPQTPYTSNGNASPAFTGSLIVATMTVNGGGNGRQVFNWVCDLAAVIGKATDGGLVR